MDPLVYLAHAGTGLQKVSTAGVVSAALTLPAGVTIVNTRPARIAVLAWRAAIVNAPSVNLLIDLSDWTVWPLNPAAAPAAAPVVARTAGPVYGGPHGVYRYWVSFAIKRGGIVITESPFSPPSAEVNAEAWYGEESFGAHVTLSGIPTSSYADVNCRRLYRPVAGGADRYWLADLDDNVTTTYEDAIVDGDLSLLPALNDLGLPPGADATDRMVLLVAWKNRLFGVGLNEPDTLRWCGADRPYAWAPWNSVRVRPSGQPLTALAARRNELVPFKADGIWKFIGTDETDFSLVQVAEGVGSVSQDATITVHDTVYFLGPTDFWEYGPSGVLNLSRQSVHNWFATDTYFNRSRFPNAFAVYDPALDVIELHLAALGSSVEDRWVSFHRGTRKWFGPHKTSALTPTAATLLDLGTGISVPVRGSAGDETGADLYVPQTSAADDGLAIVYDVAVHPHDGDLPDWEKFWGELTVLSRRQAQGTLSIYPAVGVLNAAEQPAIAHDLSRGRQCLRHLGKGQTCALRFYNAENGQAVSLYGYSLPHFPLRRL